MVQGQSHQIRGRYQRNRDWGSEAQVHPHNSDLHNPVWRDSHRRAGQDKCLGHSRGQVYGKLEVYKVLAKLENEKHSPDLLAGLPDPSVLSVRQQTSFRTVYGASRRCNTAVFTARSTIEGNTNNLSDRPNMTFVVSTQKWLFYMSLFVENHRHKNWVNSHHRPRYML